MHCSGLARSRLERPPTSKWLGRPISEAFLPGFCYSALSIRFYRSANWIPNQAPDRFSTGFTPVVGTKTYSRTLPPAPLPGRPPGPDVVKAREATMTVSIVLAGKGRD